VTETNRGTGPADGTTTPGIVIGAVAAATAVVPFLIVYSFLFIARGVFVQVEQPDITSSRHGEAFAGLVALLFLLLVVWGIVRLLNGGSRPLFWLGQLITLAGSVWFVIDRASGDPQVPLVTALTALLALALSLTPAASRWVRSGGGEAATDATFPGIAAVQPAVAAPIPGQQG